MVRLSRCCSRFELLSPSSGRNEGSAAHCCAVVPGQPIKCRKVGAAISTKHDHQSALRLCVRIAAKAPTQTRLPAIEATIAHDGLFTNGGVGGALHARCVASHRPRGPPLPELELELANRACHSRFDPQHQGECARSQYPGRQGHIVRPSRYLLFGWKPIDPLCRSFSTVPKHVQDGSEDVLPAGLLSGAPIDLQARTVRYTLRRPHFFGTR